MCNHGLGATEMVYERDMRGRIDETNSLWISVYYFIDINSPGLITVLWLCKGVSIWGGWVKGILLLGNFCMFEMLSK